MSEAKVPLVIVTKISPLARLPSFASASVNVVGLVEPMLAESLKLILMLLVVRLLVAPVTFACAMVKARLFTSLALA